ncbi:hypothetical protein BI362_11670 [Streptococcus parauberis]|nr:hypothetical protein BI362_11670 [Streptococcus parauberis]
MSEKYLYNDFTRRQMQDNLKNLRETLGWTSEHLGNLLGVSKQTVSNIETKSSNLTKLHFIAIRTVIDHEVKQLKNKNLEKAKIMELQLLLLFNTENEVISPFNKVDREKIKEVSQLVSKTSTIKNASLLVTALIPIVGSVLQASLQENKHKKSNKQKQ